MKIRLMIIDGHALLHRAWHALPPLSTKDGLVVSGVYGFLMILLKAIKDVNPTHLVVAFDLAGPTFRHEEYEKYKATREKKPDELYAQIPIIEEVLNKMNIPFYSAKGFEADDVIGTIASQVRKSNSSAEIFIVTGDKDTLQLVDSKVSVYTWRKSMTDTVLYGPIEVKEKMGVRPDQMVDYKALRGDPSDNISGVRGIGDKTAVDLLNEFETLEKIYKVLDSEPDKISQAIRRKLENGREDAFLSQHLCQIKTDIEIDFDLKRAEYRPVSKDEMRSTFERYQFNRLLSQLPKSDSDEVRRAGGQLDLLSNENATESAINETNWQEINSVKELKQYFSSLITEYRKIPWASFGDLKTNGFLAIHDKLEMRVIPGPLIREALEEIRSFILDSKLVLVCHDLKSEIKRWLDVGIELEKSQIFDLMLASYLLHAGERKNSLESILSYYRNVMVDELKIVDELDDLHKAKSRLLVALPHFVSLAEELELKLNENKLNNLFQDIEMPLSAVLARMEVDGVGLDSNYLFKLSTEINFEINELTKKIYELAGENFNINSPAQLKEILFNKLHLTTVGIKKTDQGKTLSTAASELVKLQDQHEIVNIILDYRELAKLKSTYIDALPPLVDKKTGRIHANFNQTVTATGRLSSSDPNLQNIPTTNSSYGRQVRDAFIARPGSVYLAADYSQIELRIAAHIADERDMIEAFRLGEDIHYRTAVEMFGEDEAVQKRKIAKAINFGILYGMGPQRLALGSNLPLSDARDYIEQYFALHPGIENYIHKIKEKLSKDGCVETIFGRKRFFPNFHLLNKREQSEAERQAVNMPIQGTSADMIKMAMISLDRIIGRKYGRGDEASARLILQVHDELIFEVENKLVDELASLVKEEMTKVVNLKVPIVVNLSIGSSWGSLQKLD